MIKKYLRQLITYLKRFDRVEQDELVSYLIRNTASLALKKDEYVEFAPVPGTCGTVKLRGNSLPVFTYLVFEKSIMEFIEVSVEVSKPNRVTFTSTITSTTAPERHGESVETTERYREPFYVLANHLFMYFPFPMEGGRKKNESI